MLAAIRSWHSQVARRLSTQCASGNRCLWKGKTREQVAFDFLEIRTLVRALQFGDSVHGQSTREIERLWVVDSKHAVVIRELESGAAHGIGEGNPRVGDAERIRDDQSMKTGRQDELAG